MNKKIVREVIIWIPTILLILMFTNAGGRKFFVNGGWTWMFHRLNLPDWFRYTTGVLELAAAILLIRPRTAFYGAVLVVTIMIGAVGILLMNGMTHVGPPAAAMVVGIFVAVMRAPRVRTAFSGSQARV